MNSCVQSGKTMKKSKKTLAIVIALLTTLIIGLFLLSYFRVVEIPFVTDLMYKTGMIYREKIKANILEDNYVPVEDSIQFDTENNIYYADNEMIIVFNSDASKSEIEKTIDDIDGEHVGTVPSLDLYQICLNQKYTLEELQELADELTKKYKIIQFATYDSAVETAQSEVSAIAPKDKWNKDVDENDWKDNDVDGVNWWLEVIEAPKAWVYNDQMAEITIGISDSSFDVRHEDLKNKCSFPNKLLESRNNTAMWWNDGDKESKYSDSQTNAHGTHVAGIIGAEHDNKKGISGVVKKCNLLLAPQYSSEISNKYLAWDSSIYSNLSYLVNSGAKVVNYSQGKSKWTNGYSSDFLKREGNLAATLVAKLLEERQEENSDFIIVQSAGNGNASGKPVDAYQNGWFCSVTDESVTGSETIDISEVKNHIIVVGAAKQKDDKIIVSDYSNYGDQVDIYAPGDKIYSTLPGDIFYGFEFFGSYGESQGTSMAAPIVSGVCSLVWSANTELSADQVKDIVCSPQNTNIEVGSNSENPKFTTGSLVNAYLSVEAAFGWSSEKSDAEVVVEDIGFKSSDSLIYVDDKIIYAKNDGIYYRESPTSTENIIASTQKDHASAQNTRDLLSDGETVFFTVNPGASSDNFGAYYQQDEVYSIKVNGENLSKLFKTEGDVKLVTCYDDYLFYLNNHDSNYSYSSNQSDYMLNKYNIETGENVEFSNSDLGIANGDSIGDFVSVGTKIYLEVFSSEGSYDNCDIIEFDTKSSKANNVLQNAHIVSPSTNAQQDVVCFETSGDNDWYVYSVNLSGEMTKSEKIPSRLTLSQGVISSDGSFALMRSDTNESDFDLYKVNLKTGKIEVIENGAGCFKNKGAGLTYDKKHCENIYVTGPGGTSLKFNGSGYDKVKTEEDSASMSYWLIDGYFIARTTDYSDFTWNKISEVQQENNEEQISVDEATEIARQNAGGDGYGATYVKNVEYNGEEYYLINIKWRVDDGDGKFHYSHIGYSIVSLDGKDVKNAYYINGQVQVY